ncbi:hypothetical protein TRVA0_033S00870 [Trichomonascus vanleenenianus]|uniref:uncharacterized protein n=1 Tax=Trichomonascus vanleenenianus TaxID=2268995 RepID=UPI003EC9942B
MIWSRVVFDFHLFNRTKINQYEDVACTNDESRWTRVATISGDVYTQLRFDERQLAEFCTNVATGRYQYLLTRIRSLTVMMPEDLGSLDDERDKPLEITQETTGRKLAAWVLTNLLTPENLPRLETLQVKTPVLYNGPFVSSQRVSPAILLERFTHCTKTLVLTTGELANCIHLYGKECLERVKVMKLGISDHRHANGDFYKMIPGSLEALYLYPTKHVKLFGADFKESLSRLTHLKLLSMRGIGFEMTNGNWLPPSVETLEMQFSKPNRGVFPHVRALRINYVTADPFKTMRFPNLESLYIENLVGVSIEKLSQSMKTDPEFRIHELHMFGKSFTEVSHVANASKIPIRTLVMTSCSPDSTSALIEAGQHLQECIIRFRVWDTHTVRAVRRLITKCPELKRFYLYGKTICPLAEQSHCKKWLNLLERVDLNLWANTDFFHIPSVADDTYIALSVDVDGARHLSEQDWKDVLEPYHQD